MTVGSKVLLAMIFLFTIITALLIGSLTGDVVKVETLDSPNKIGKTGYPIVNNLPSSGYEYYLNIPGSSKKYELLFYDEEKATEFRSLSPNRLTTVKGILKGGKISVTSLE